MNIIKVLLFLIYIFNLSICGNNIFETDYNIIKIFLKNIK